MRVILKSDVSKLGKAGSLIDVSDGHARNFLIPELYPFRLNADTSTNCENLATNSFILMCEFVTLAFCNVAMWLVVNVILFCISV